MVDGGSERRFFRGGTVEDQQVFRARLAEMKQTGCSVLVTGNLSDSVRAKHMQRALGNSTHRQILVSNYEDANRFLPESVSPGDQNVRVIRSNDAKRTVETADQNTSTGSDYLQDLRTLRNNIWDATDDLHEYGELSAGDLRVSVDSLETFLGGQSSVKEFMTDVSRHVALVNGITYFYLERPTDSAVVKDLSSLVDARIECRSEDSDEHRWVLPDEEVSSDWLPL